MKYFPVWTSLSYINVAFDVILFCLLKNPLGNDDVTCLVVVLICGFINSVYKVFNTGYGPCCCCWKFVS